MYRIRLQTNIVKAIILLLLFIVLELHSITLNAQSSRSPDQDAGIAPQYDENFGATFRGMGVSFGVRAFTLRSNIAALNQLTVLQEGGQTGFFFGNRVLRAKVGLLGFFYSSACVPQTINVFEGEAALNYYPVNVNKGQRAVEPYLTSGLIYNNLRFSGHYLTDHDNLNTSRPEPYLGAIHKVDATIGAGVEIGLLNYRHFVHLFTEMKYGINLYQAASNNTFDDTTVSNQTMISIGLRFGSFK